MKNFIAKMGAVLLTIGAALTLSGCGEDSGTNANNGNGSNFGAGEKMVDPRDGQAYKTVQIGKQTWMAENLNYQTSESMCYEDKPENCEKYGRLYGWNEAVTVCPEGWHLPSKEEFEELEKLAGQKAGDIDEAGTVLKSTTGWKNEDGKSGNGINGLGFGALPAGDYYGYDDFFSNEGAGAYFWSSTEGDSRNAYRLYLYYFNESADVNFSSKDYAFSVRCVNSGTSSEVENETSPNVNMGSMVDSRDGQAYKTVQIGKQTWMAENLNYQTSESMCYEDKPENCEKYGRLYDWNEAVTACPDGWHLPNEQELEDLRTLAGKKAGDIDKAGTVLKSTTGWKNKDGKSGNGINGLGFGALPAGSYNSYYGYFGREGKDAYFWSSTEGYSNNAYYLLLAYDHENAGVRYGNEGADVNRNGKDNAFSVRCVKN